MYARLTIQSDIHVTGNPIGYEFGMDDDEEIETETTASSQSWLHIIALTSGLVGLLLLVTLMNERKDSAWEEEQ